MESFYSYLIISIVVLILLFLVFREVVCWYYKINESISLQIKTNELLEILSANKSLNSEQNIDNLYPIIDPINNTYDQIIGEKKKIENLEIAQFDFPNKMNWKTAITFCKYLENGWRLPNKYEFNFLYINKDKIGGFSNECYWSSTEYDHEYAWNRDFTNGDQNTDSYNSLHNVRAVRSI